MICQERHKTIRRLRSPDVSSPAYALVTEFDSDAEGNSRRCGDSLAQVAVARRARPQADRRTLYVSSTWAESAAEGRTNRSGRDESGRRAGSAHARPATARNLAKERTLRNGTRRLVQSARPGQKRMGVGADS